MISQGDVEMSIISKNFFFTFFNLFVVFTVFGTVSNIFEARDLLGEQLRDLSRISWVLAKALGKLAPFYMNLIILQGLGLFPFRLLEFGAVSLYPVYLMGAKTPRGMSFRLDGNCFYTNSDRQIMPNLSNPLCSATDSFCRKPFSYS